MAVRLRAIRRRAAAWRRRARRAMTLALATAGMSLVPSISLAQMGQTAMAPAGGIVNRAATGFRDLNENGPGIFYYGINAADRGLGYVGSYMTLGGFVPLAEDDLGGFWAADLRGHLSEYGGFFSNVGAVRKQFIGGTLLGVGVYWDYDGDMNQYPDTVIPGVSTSYTFPGGQVYNQVGVSGEWLTDYGNLRSNGYIPVGSTAQLLGPFVGNSILCAYGINAALGGADLEVGAYIPGLADWAGMISVGGYALGNTAYQFPGGMDAVPWFGGVYTRLDMTFVDNWDFSLQYNNDSYFESTGFARLSYRMGGSRRRNVPDQAEQPMMRNEHIVRAYQQPVVATNPNNRDAAGNPLPWQVFHVDNSAAAGGNGTAEAPFQNLTAAEGAALAAFDIVYVHVGNSLTNPYITPIAGYSFAANNQYLVGEGTTLRIPTVTCGPKSLQFSDTPNLYPVVTNPAGTAINLNKPGTRVAHLQISSSNVAITGNLESPGRAFVSDVIIAGSNGPLQRGVEISGGPAGGEHSFFFNKVRLSNLGNDGFVIADAKVSISNSSLTKVSGDGVRAGTGAEVTITKTSFTGTNGRAVVASGKDSTITIGNSTIANTTGLPGHAVVASGENSTITLANTRITDTLGSALVASGAGSTIAATGSTITGTGNPAILLTGNDSTVALDASKVSKAKGDGVLVDAAGATFVMQNASVIDSVTGNGISVQDADASAFVLSSSKIENTGVNGIVSGNNLSPAGADGGSLLVRDSTIRNVDSAAIRAFGVAGTSAAGPERVVAVQGSTIGNAQLGGIVTSNSNLRVERLDNTDPTSRQTTISNTGPWGIQATANTVLPGAVPPGAPYPYRVLVADTRITGSTQGIAVAAAPDVANPPPVADFPPLAPGEQYPTTSVPTIEFTATNNQITTTGGRGITVSAVFDPFNGTGFFPPGRPLSRVNASIVLNTITAPGFDIQLNGGPTQFIVNKVLAFAPDEQLPITVEALSQADLGDINNGATVGIPAFTDIYFNPALVVPPPPPPPIPPP